MRAGGGTRPDGGPGVHALDRGEDAGRRTGDRRGGGPSGGRDSFDCLHFDRCGAALDELDALPEGSINYIQLCDGPEPWDPSDAELIRVARTARLVPGEGGIDLPAILRRLPPGLPVSVEVPNHAEAARTGAVALARRALEASRTMIAAVEAGR